MRMNPRQSRTSPRPPLQHEHGPERTKDENSHPIHTYMVDDPLTARDIVVSQSSLICIDYLNFQIKALSVHKVRFATLI